MSDVLDVCGCVCMCVGVYLQLRRPSGPFWGPQQERRVILWESLSLEDQQKCVNDLQDDTEWVIWCKAKPKDMATQAFRAYGQCIFEGKREKPKQAKGTQDSLKTSREESMSSEQEAGGSKVM